MKKKDIDIFIPVFLFSFCCFCELMGRIIFLNMIISMSLLQKIKSVFVIVRYAFSSTMNDVYYLRVVSPYFLELNAYKRKNFNKFCVNS